MATIHIEAVKEPLASPDVAREAVAAIGRADAMGLLPSVDVRVLDVPTLQQVLRRIRRADLARGLIITDVDMSHLTGTELIAQLRAVNQILEESPVPDTEWGRLLTVFGPERLGELLNLSISSVRRYSSRRRDTPDDVAARLHHLALIVGDLAGAYNMIGIRRWFQRPRRLLDGRMPAALLKGDWAPSDAGPQRVRALAQQLVFATAT